MNIQQYLQPKRILAVLKFGRRFFFSIMHLLLVLLNFLVFKKQANILFSQAKSRYNGNSRYLFEYLAKHNAPVYWLYTDAVQKERIPIALHSRLIPRHSFSGFCLALTSKFFVICHGSSDLGHLWHLAKHNTVLNLWHAIGIKKTGLLDNQLNDKQAPSTVFKAITQETRYYSYMTVSSSVDRYVTSASHAIDVRKVLSLGNPKTDHYLQSKAQHKPNDVLTVLYAPTFRDSRLDHELFFPFADFTTEALGTLFKQHPMKLYLRPHPNDTDSNAYAMSLEQQYPDNIVYYSQQVCDDVDAALHEFDVIISDYSSIYIEPLLADTPCIFIPFDMDSYLSNRGLAYDYEQVTPGPKVNTFVEFTDALIDAEKGAHSWQTQRMMVRQLFFDHIDTRACERIAQHVFNLTTLGPK